MGDFSDFDLDERIFKAISKLKWSKPTEVQKKTIPLALEGKDLIVRAKTGSGKTAAYLIPVIQTILKTSKILTDGDEKKTAVILVPSKELSKQAYRNALELTSCCSKTVRVIDVGNSSVQNVASLIPLADLIIGTPAKLLAHVNNNTFDMKSKMNYLVIDEADLMLSFGYENDLNVLVKNLPKIYQALLVSATIGSDVEHLKSQILRDPVILKLKESDMSEDGKLNQFVVKCEANDKFLLVYALFKLNLIQGKNLIFVNTIDKSYRLKLFFEQFYIKTCVLNSELPQNSRIHIVDEFNKGVYDTIIATDESIAIDTEKSQQDKTAKKADKEYNVSRGIDFQDVDNVINLDFPINPDAYIHRVGRTARGDNSGTALSFVASPTDQANLLKLETKLKEVNNTLSASLKPYNFKIDEIKGLRYRVNDAASNVTKLKIKDARLKEIKGEIFNSTKLKTYFEDNPTDLKVLRHDRILAPTDQQPHMKNVPDYLVPESLKQVMLKPKRKRKQYIPIHDKQKKKAKRNTDPLKTFKSKKKQNNIQE